MRPARQWRDLLPESAARRNATKLLRRVFRGKPIVKVEKGLFR
jgi:hypothetical protein